VHFRIGINSPLSNHGLWKGGVGRRHYWTRVPGEPRKLGSSCPGVGNYYSELQSFLYTHRAREDFLPSNFKIQKAHFQLHVSVFIPLTYKPNKEILQ
jgi:hypothetical protein